MFMSQAGLGEGSFLRLGSGTSQATSSGFGGTEPEVVSGWCGICSAKVLVVRWGHGSGPRSALMRQVNLN